MTDLTPEQRARALELYRLHHELRHGEASYVDTPEDLLEDNVRAWLSMEAHVLASHACPDADADERVKAWNAIAQHPFLADCYQTEGTLLDAMLAKLDAAHSHTCAPVWRPTTADEIQPGWEVRSRHRSGSESSWGVAHRRDGQGDWRTEAGRMLTFIAAVWTYETTAPAPEPEPWPDELVEALADTMATTPGGATWQDDARAVLGLLDRLAHMTEARDNARAEVERLAGVLAEVRATAEHYDGRAYADGSAAVLRILGLDAFDGAES